MTSSRLQACVLSFFLASLCGCGSEPDSDRLQIAVLPKGTTHEFWKSLHAGALKAAQESEGVEILWRGAVREDDRNAQLGLVETCLSQRVDALVLAPLDRRALVGPVRQATQMGIPVIIVDSGLDAEAGKDFLSYVATDNRLAGEMAGKYLADQLGGKGKILLVRYVEGSESTTEREEGFLEALTGFPEIEVIDPNRYAGASRASAQEAVENLLSVHPEVNAIFGPAEPVVHGALLALRQRGLAGQVKLMGFDPSPALVEAMEAGEVMGIILQDPMKMGYWGVQSALRALKGESVPSRQDTGVGLATPENRNDPEIRSLLFPDWRAYVSE
ncbi:MAG: sugar ABC transporter substrate-binding protein [Planctomycetota bacterium]|nr:MAG: sugar ABC transporter substrate-binding protein [Planctomycetota bacterium]